MREKGATRNSRWPKIVCRIGTGHCRTLRGSSGFCRARLGNGYARSRSAPRPQPSRNATPRGTPRRKARYFTSSRLRRDCGRTRGRHFHGAMPRAAGAAGSVQKNAAAMRRAAGELRGRPGQAGRQRGAPPKGASAGHPIVRSPGRRCAARAGQGAVGSPPLPRCCCRNSRIFSCLDAIFAKCCFSSVLTVVFCWSLRLS